MVLAFKMLEKNQRIRGAEGCLHFFERLSGDVVVKSIMICCQSSCAHYHVCHITPVCVLLLCLEKILVLYYFFSSELLCGNLL